MNVPSAEKRELKHTKKLRSLTSLFIIPFLESNNLRIDDKQKSCIC